MAQVKGINTGAVREYRSLARRDFLEWAWRMVNQMPEGEAFYQRIIIPEVSLPDEEIELIEQLSQVAG